jgi:hypothetical protein
LRDGLNLGLLLDCSLKVVAIVRLKLKVLPLIKAASIVKNLLNG